MLSSTRNPIAGITVKQDDINLQEKQQSTLTTGTTMAAVAGNVQLERIKLEKFDGDI